MSYIHRNRGNRRKKNSQKALRKARIIHALHDYWNYNSLHELSKGKIHCSCPLCAAKTNAKLNKSKGPINNTNRNLCRLAVTNNRYGRKNYKISDKKKVDSMNYQFVEYEVK